MLKRNKNVEKFVQRDNVNVPSVQNGQYIDGANLRKDWQKVGSYLRYTIWEEGKDHGSVCEGKN